jgi:hypothetical protein
MHRGLNEMRLRTVVIPIWFAGLLTVAPIRGYAFNLSQMLSGGEEQDLKAFKLIHVADLKALLAGSRDTASADKLRLNAMLGGRNKIYIYDANGAQTRERFGIIPSATLLASDDDYPLSVLPANKHAKLVFYCADSH